MYYNSEKDLSWKILRSKFLKTPIYTITFESLLFYSREYEVMTPFSKNPITFGWKQVIQYTTGVTCDHVPYS